MEHGAKNEERTLVGNIITKLREAREREPMYGLYIVSLTKEQLELLIENQQEYHHLLLEV